ncbi:hypothetical protein ACFRCQ_08335 [Cytobacillus firmus]|uniref:hypothetical protein n=1 Tax=Cytobacillus firmus TaxID=1399 RepID=UPI0036B96C70
MSTHRLSDAIKPLAELNTGINGSLLPDPIGGVIAEAMSNFDKETLGLTGKITY